MVLIVRQCREDGVRSKLYSGPANASYVWYEPTITKNANTTAGNGMERYAAVGIEGGPSKDFGNCPVKPPLWKVIQSLRAVVAGFVTDPTKKGFSLEDVLASESAAVSALTGFELPGIQPVDDATPMKGLCELPGMQCFLFQNKIKCFLDTLIQKIFF